MGLTPIEDIEVGERRREDYGDIAGLAKSIKRYGLIHPVVIANGRFLVVGGRRLEACKRLGMVDIETREYGTISEAERQEIELEENLRRKDLTPYEQARELVRKAPVVADGLSSQFNDKRARGHQRQYAIPKEDVAQALGVSKGSLVNAEQHVATADAYPFMQQPDWKQYHVLEAREHLEKLPEPVRQTAAAIMSEPAVPPKTAVALVRNLAEMPAEKQERVVALYGSEDARDKSLAKTIAAELPPSPDQRTVILPELVRTLKQCSKLYDDCFRPELEAAAAGLDALRKRMVAAHRERVASND